MSISTKKSTGNGRILLLGSVGFLLFLTAVQLGLYLYGYDFSAQLYLPGALPLLTGLIWTATASGAALLAFTLPAKKPCREFTLSANFLTDYAALLTAAALISTTLLPLLSLKTLDPLSALLTSQSLSEHTAQTMLRLSMIFGGLAALAFLLQFANRKTNPYGVSALLLWAGFSALRIYFDMRYLLMSPRRVLHLVALVALLVFAIGELRLARKIATPRLYVLTAAPAMVLMGTDAITNLLLTAMGWITLGAEISTYCVLLAASVYAFARLYALVTPAKQSSAPVIVASDVSPEDKNSPDTENNSPEESEEVPQ